MHFMFKNRLGNKVLALFSVLVSFYVSFCFVAQTKVDYTGYIADIFPLNWMDSLAPLDWISIVAFGVLGSAVFHVFGAFLGGSIAVHSSNSGPPVDRRETSLSYFLGHLKQFILFFTVVFACWLLVFLNYYPGTSMNDQLVIIQDPILYSATHPFIYCLSLSGLVDLSNMLFGNGNYGFAVFTLMQMASNAFVVAVVALWMKYRRCSNAVVAVVLVFFVLTPVVQNYAICSIKDSPFSFYCILLVPFLYEYVTKRTSFWLAPRHTVYLVIICAAMGLTRNNGQYIVIVLLAILFFCSLQTEGFRKFFAAAILSVALAFGPGFVAGKIMNSDHLFSETVGLPLQQLAAVVCVDGTMTDAQREQYKLFINSDAAKRCYSPVFSDPVKLNLREKVIDIDYIQTHRSEFMMLWLSLALENPDTYAKAWLCETYAVWAPSADNTEQSYFFGLSDNFNPVPMQQLADDLNLQTHSLYPEPIASVIDAFERSFTCCLSTGGLFVAYLLLSLLIAYTRGSARYLFVALPGFLLWGTLLVSVPLSGALRYGVMLLLSLPVLLGCLSAKYPLLETLPTINKGSQHARKPVRTSSLVGGK